MFIFRILSLLIFKLYIPEIRFRGVFPSPFNLDICTVNCRTETEKIE